MPDRTPLSSTPSLDVVHVELGVRSYDVVIGAGVAVDAARRIVAVCGPARCVIVTDRNVADRGHLAALEQALRPTVPVLGSIVLPAGETTKSFTALGRLSEDLLRTGLERRDVVIALGGGVIGDLAGFAAGILRRGVRFIQIPTSLLAQVDSSVGGKTGINTPQGKNLIGAFHQPSLVLADIDLLATLPDREMRAGYGEVVKYGLLGDAAFFDWLEINGRSVLARDPVALASAVTRCVQMKADIVQRDETEQGDRMLLNLGHTFGHAFEAWAGFSDRLLHGEAVGLGTALAFRFSQELGHCPPGTAERVERHLTTIGLPTRVHDIPGNGPTDTRPHLTEIMSLMRQDKKVRDGQLTLILAHGIGQAFVSRDVPHARVERFLAAELQPALP